MLARAAGSRIAVMVRPSRADRKRVRIHDHPFAAQILGKEEQMTLENPEGIHAVRPFINEHPGRQLIELLQAQHAGRSKRPTRISTRTMRWRRWTVEQSEIKVMASAPFPNYGLSIGCHPRSRRRRLTSLP